MRLNLLLIFLLLLLLVTPISGQTSGKQPLKDCSSCSTRVVYFSELDSLNSRELRLLKNEIYARKGYTFSNKELKEHFSQYAWYKPLADNAKIVLNDIEKENLESLDFVFTLKEVEELLMNPEGFPLDSKDKYLSEHETDSIFTDAICVKLGLYKIWKVYQYADKTGRYFLVLSENYPIRDGERSGKRDKIKAVNYKIEQDGRFNKTFELKDKLRPDSDNIFWYADLNFYTRYIYVEDFDGDGIVEPIIFYGIYDLDLSDSKVYICVYKNGVKSQIAINNSSLDGERNISVDKSFYSLSDKIKKAVQFQMAAMQKNGHSLYPYQWLKYMNEGKTVIKY